MDKYIHPTLKMMSEIEGLCTLLSHCEDYLHLTGERKAASIIHRKLKTNHAKMIRAMENKRDEILHPE